MDVWWQRTGNVPVEGRRRGGGGETGDGKASGKAKVKPKADMNRPSPCRPGVASDLPSHKNAAGRTESRHGARQRADANAGLPSEVGRRHLKNAAERRTTDGGDLHAVRRPSAIGLTRLTQRLLCAV